MKWLSGLLLISCAHTIPESVVMPEFAYFEHPLGYTLHDIHQIFFTEHAPTLYEKNATDIHEQFKNCVFKLNEQSEYQRHYCFYFSFLEFEQEFKKNKSIIDRLNFLNKRYEVLIETANYFLKKYNDKRYFYFLQWHYQGLSLTYFKRKVIPHIDRPGGIFLVQNLVKDTEPLFRHYEPIALSVLGKYKIDQMVKPLIIPKILNSKPENTVPDVDSERIPSSQTPSSETIEIEGLDPTLEEEVDYSQFDLKSEKTKMQSFEMDSGDSLDPSLLGPTP